ncbi:MAG: DUF2892 domain-containing protein [Flavobacteriia bacterium]|jgi:hypothetical protein|nr:DUF2892 domain-containing protein [Cryomorphaceae bacterium]
MTTNMGTTDKIIRIAVATGIVGLYLGNVISGTLAIVGLAIVGIFVLTSLIGFCPLYAIFGLNTCKTK